MVLSKVLRASEVPFLENNWHERAKDWCDDSKSSTYQDIATCFQSVCVKSRRFTEDSSMQSIMIPTEGQRQFHPQLDDAESSTGLVSKNGKLSHSQRDRSMLAGLRA